VTTKLKPAACLACGAPLDAATAFAEKGHASEPKPQPGDFTLCIHCGHLMVFTDDMRLRQPTRDELDEAAADQKITDASFAIAELRRRHAL
jgi:hypothetical protein